MAPKELIDIIACGETSTVQFKRQVDSVKQLVEEIVAFANSKGGTLLLGRSKRRNRLMADFCAKTMIYRGLGSGIPRALQENVRIDFVSDDSDFKVVLWRNPSLAETEGDDNVNSIVENGILNGDNGQSNSNNGTLNSDNGQLNTENGTLNSNDGQLNTEDGTLNKRQIMVLEYIASHPGTNAKEIIEKTGIPLDTLNKIIRRLTQAYRLIERRGSKKTGGYYLKSSSQE